MPQARKYTLQLVLCSEQPSRHVSAFQCDRLCVSRFSGRGLVRGSCTEQERVEPACLAQGWKVPGTLRLCLELRKPKGSGLG